MSLRSTLLAAGLAAVALAPLPAMARDKGLSEAAEKLSDPRMQETIATAMASLSQALMGMKMAPFARAMETMGEANGDREAGREIDPDATLGEMMGPEAERLPRELSARVPAMMGAMAGMAGAVEGMLPELEAMGKRLKRSLPRN